MTDLLQRSDSGPYPRARIGFICVANAGLTEGDMFAMAPPGVGLSFTRIPMQRQCTIESLARMERDLDDAARTLFPGRNDLDVMCYNCTAGSFVIGEETIRAKLLAGRAGLRATTLLSGVTAAFRALDAKRLAIATAYTPDINALERTYFEAHGFDVLSMEGLDLLTDAEMNSISPDFILDFARAVDRPDADALFVSCGALRSTGIADRLEQAIGKPVVTSNQASFWNCLRLAGVDDPINGFGTLLREH